MSQPWAYYNEYDEKAAAWLRTLIAAGLIADGEVDTRSIVEVGILDLKGFTQCHFFAGIGGWSHALRLAGWPDDQPIWTGSCPCQPFSAAGKRKGLSDERHLWPYFLGQIAEGRPPVVVGEQVASPDGLRWLDVVSTDLEDQNYAFGSADLCAAGVGAPHIRQRLYWVADTLSAGRPEGWSGAGRRSAAGSDGAFGMGDSDCSGRTTRDSVTLRTETRPSQSPNTGPSGELGDRDDPRSQRRLGAELRERAGERAAGATGASSGLADNRNAERREIDVDRENGHHGANGGREETHRVAGACGEVRDVADAKKQQRHRAGDAGPRRGESSDDCGLGGRMADADGGESGDGDVQRGGRHGQQPENPLAGFWSDAEWVYCRDDKWRPVEPGTFPLAHGVPARVGRLRGYGNAIVPQVAAAFIAAYCEARGLTWG